MIHSLDQLSPAIRAAAHDYLTRATAGLHPELRPGVLDDLTAFLCDHLAPDATLTDLRTVIEQAGPVNGGDQPSRFGRLLGRLGYGINPSGMAARIARTWWNPADERLFVPRAVGWGWDLNFGAVAVRLGLIEPDAEAEPFASTPDTAFRVAAGLPAALAAATALHYAVRGRSLPAQLPAHWDVAGAPARWTSRGPAAAADLAMTLAPAALAAWAAGSPQPRPSRAGAIAGATSLATAGAAVTVWRTLGDRPRPLAGPALALAVAGSAGMVLIGLARAGRAAEIRRDLDQDPPVTLGDPAVAADDSGAEGSK